MPEKRLADNNVRLLRQGLELIDLLDDERYGHRPDDLYGYGVGSHVRHLYEHYALFLAGFPRGRIDYDRRPRDPRLDRDRAVATVCLLDTVRALKDIPFREGDRALVVRMDGGGDPEQDGCRSTVKRELSYLAMHDIHYYAIVGLLLSSMDVPLPPGFGMAPSTLHFHGRG